MAQVFESREPVAFAAGDTLAFQRYLRDFLPGDGWSLHYEVRGEDGEAELQFDSEAAGSLHQVAVDDFAADLEPDSYVLVGFAVNGEERHRIYYGELQIGANLGTGASVAAPQKTFAQQMVEKLQTGLSRLYDSELQETDVQRTRIIRVKREELRKELNFWEERVNYERKQQMIANGQGNPNAIAPRFNVG